MQTTATNKKIRELLSDVANNRLKLRPPFQRRLVWLNKHKIAFIRTVLEGYPFPEIFVATGELNVDTGEGVNLLVDGQQRLSTLREYFTGSKDLRLLGEVTPYAELGKVEKEEFLNYVVVVRDLGKVEPSQLKEAFARINATAYPLNAVELDNAQYEGEFKNAAQKLADALFFANNDVFSAADIRRMRDLRLCLRLIATVLESYFNGYKAVERFLERYNENFPHEREVLDRFAGVFEFVDRCEFPKDARIWQQADLFTALVELYWALYRDMLSLDPARVRSELLAFYRKVDAPISAPSHPDVGLYRKSASLATNNRNSQIQRGIVVRHLLEQSQAVPVLFET